MQEHSELWQEIYDDPTHTTFPFVEIYGAPDWPIILFDSSTISKLEIELNTMEMHRFSLGNCVSREATLELVNPDVDVDLALSEVFIVTVALRRKDSDEPSGYQYSELLPKGKFFVDSVKKDISQAGITTFTIHGYDCVSLMDYEAELLQKSYTDVDLVDYIINSLSQLQIDGIDAESRAIINKGYTIAPVEGQTYRQILSGIAALYFATFYVGVDSKLHLTRFVGGAPRTDIGRSLNRLTVENSQTMTGIVLDTGNNVRYNAGNQTGFVVGLYSPYGTQHACNDMERENRSYHYQPFTAEGAHVNPAIESLDNVKIDGKIFYPKIMHEHIGPNYTVDMYAPKIDETNKSHPGDHSNGAKAPETEWMKNRVQCGELECGTIEHGTYKDYQIAFPEQFNDWPIVVCGIENETKSLNYHYIKIAVVARNTRGATIRVFNSSPESNFSPWIGWIAAAR